MDLRCPTWARRICTVGFTGFDSDFRWDMLGNSMRFLDWLDQRVTVEETALYQSPTGEPGRQANQRVDGGSVGCFGPENAKLVELVDDAGCRLPIAAPQPGKVDLGGHELPWL